MTVLANSRVAKKLTTAKICEINHVLEYVTTKAISC